MRSKQLLKSLILGVALAVGSDSASAQIVQELIAIDGEWKYNDSGANLGTEWRTEAFNDSSWSSGPAALGFPAGEGLPLTSIQTVIQQGSSPQTITFYFRKTFVLTGSPQGITLIASNVVDDGAVFYLNGVEVGRIAMPTGVISSTTGASRASDANTTGVEALDIPIDALREGTNLFAVEVHQANATSSDVVFASRLMATSPGTGPAVFQTQPQSVSSNQGESVTFRVTVSGTPPYNFQWYKNGEPVPGATDAFLTFPSLTLGDAGEYTVTVQNALGSATSTPALLTIVEGPITMVAFGREWRYLVTGGDQGSAWKEIGFNDSSWPAGPGPIGDEGAALPEALQTMFDLTAGRLTYYFRTKFEFSGEPLDFELALTTLIDDGAVIHLNGQEILRIGMEAGSVGFGTIANRTIGEAGLETFTVPGEFLRVGENTLAVEVHQVNATSSDVVAGVRVVANPTVPSTLAILQQPVDLEVEEVKAARMEVVITGNNPRFQWFRVDGGMTNLIDGANRSVYTITNVVLGDNGSQFFVVISNIVNRITSDVITLSVIPDVVAPKITRADGTLNATTVIVTFDEPLLRNPAEIEANYRIADTQGGANLTIVSAILTNATNVVLTTSARMANRNYILTVNDVEDLVDNTIANDSMRPISIRLELIRISSIWQYWDPVPIFNEGPITGTAWYTDPTFDVASQTPPGEPYDWFWRSGAGALVNDATGQDFPAPKSTPLPQTQFLRTIFRNSFAFSASDAGATLRLRHLVDDGAIFYLNGEEVSRFNLSPGPVGADTPANATVGVASFQTVELPISLLRSGTNFMAVGLHQSGAFSVDKAFAMELTAIVDSLIVGPVMITSQPGDQTVIEGQPATFNFIGVAGSAFQWKRNGSPIAGATNAIYTIPAAGLGDNAARFSVDVSNNTGMESSEEATLTVVLDMAPPRVVSARGEGLQVILSFDEPINPATGNNLANYIVNNTTNIPQTVISAVTSGNEVVLTLTSQPVPGYSVTLDNLSDTSTSQNVMMEAVTITVGFGGAVLPFDAVWSYDFSDTDLGTAWRNITYASAANWRSGAGLLGQETASLPFPLRTSFTNAAPNAGGPITVYYRSTFNWPAAGPLTLNISHVVDDGFVIYCNGQEFYRYGMPATQAHNTFSTLSVGDGVLQGPFSVTIPNVMAGPNVLAAEVHQINATSSDTVFGVELSRPDIPSVIVPVILPPEAPTLSLQRVGNQVVISWDKPADRFVLERSITISGPWVVFPRTATGPGTSSLAQPRIPPSRIFRLRQVE